MLFIYLLAPVNAASSVVLFHLADVCGAIDKARKAITNNAQKLCPDHQNAFADYLETISGMLSWARPSFDPKTGREVQVVKHWPSFFTLYKRKAVEVIVNVSKLASMPLAEQSKVDLGLNSNPLVDLGLELDPDAAPNPFAPKCDMELFRKAFDRSPSTENHVAVTRTRELPASTHKAMETVAL